MAIYVLGDPHLSLSGEKPMDIFGNRWANHTQKIKNAWRQTVREEDTVVLAGDISWAMSLKDAEADLEFFHNLPGKKILLKGNHDYWWTTASKLRAFTEQNSLSSITFLHNNSILIEEYAICTCRGWKSPYESDFNGEDRKIYEREMLRLELSLKEGCKLSDKRIVMMHYPPDVGFAEILTEYNVEFCVYGHLHGKKAWNKFMQSKRDLLVSADYLEFKPKCILR